MTIFGEAAAGYKEKWKEMPTWQKVGVGVAGAAALPFLTAGTALALAPAITKGGIGLYQSAKAKKALKDLERPEYEIPEEIKQNLSAAQQRALEGLPAEQKQQFAENIQRSIQTGLAASKGRGGGLSAIGGLAQQEMDAYRQLLGADVEARLAGEQALTEQRGIMGGQKAQQWQINLMEPYLHKYSEAVKREAAGRQMQMQALESGTQTLLQGASMGMGGMGGGMPTGGGGGMPTGAGDLYR